MPILPSAANPRENHLLAVLPPQVVVRLTLPLEWIPMPLAAPPVHRPLCLWLLLSLDRLPASGLYRSRRR